MIGFGSLGFLAPPQYQLAAKLVVTLLVVTFLVGFGFKWGYGSANSKWELATNKVKADAASKLQAVTDLAREKENAYKQEAQKDEIEYYEALDKIEKLRADKSALAASKRMYDPGGRKSCPNPVPKRGNTVVPTDAAETDPSELSRTAGRFLQEESIRADTALRECNRFKESAHKWAVSAAAHQSLDTD